MKSLAILMICVGCAAAQPTKPSKSEPKPKTVEKQVQPSIEAICGKDGSGCLTYTTTPMPLYATWTNEVKDGVYTATFTDPNNKWRCYITSTDGEGAGRAIQSFTMTCIDTTLSGVPQPLPNGGH